MSELAVSDNNVDKSVDEEIRACLDPANPKSFFLYAGAGSGKTRSLVDALKHLRKKHGPSLWLQGRRVGIITYTNAAADEVRRRAEFDPLIEVATIHSFLWSLVSGYNHDIRDWLRSNLAREIEVLEDAQRRGRAGKESERRARSIISKTERLARLDEVRAFTYSPDGENRGRDALNHAEVISLGSTFISTKPALGQLLVNRYPILFIDESQDTNKNLIDALFALQNENQDRFCLGLFGDMMQRIYADGKPGLAELVPDTWAKPVKVMNHRCRDRIVKLINEIRKPADGQQQQSRIDKAGGTVRLFVASKDANKAAIERAAAIRMADITGDQEWKVPTAVKMLALEHLMSARRLGFEKLFAPLNAIDRLKTGLLAGTLPGLRFFSHGVIPLVQAQQRGDRFAVAAILRRISPLLSPLELKRAGADQLEQLDAASQAVDELLRLWDGDGDPSCQSVLETIGRSKLLEVPEVLKSLLPIAGVGHIEFERLLAEAGIEPDEPTNEEGVEQNAILEAWSQSLQAPMSQVTLYQDYVEGISPFDTHQGVKGLEFPRVMVVIDDDEARGFMFSYNKLLGTTPKSKTDLQHEAAGEETTLDRTRRLLYVTCSRAEESLLVMLYAHNQAEATTGAKATGWFADDEIELILAA
ncbi:ATP-dependent helicase [Rhizobium sp. RMa-01]|uniref:UvrD-helicase domain-containing protein n=1 Tax=unclassified Rhizobium TaxID=2613769 RepID=UPI0008D9A142|nr:MULTISPECIES: UvrD-helicase domain-containing protein [unclassified Rhizobium]OHV25060.1 Fis family transcriptional regulator [Rhizobium sp. RSm-3]RVU08229.1 ATP-dependent helicase [Rhizobium sp. RMa-01]